MNSGQTRESKHQIAVLEDEDVETFVAFCEYAYTGDYAVPPPGGREDDREQDMINNPFRGMFTSDSNASSPPSGLAPSPGRPAAAAPRASDSHPQDSASYAEDGYDEETPDENAAWYLSTTTDYPPQDPTATPRDSDRSPVPSPDASSSRGRRRQRGRRGRKNSKEQQLLTENTVSKLTPPCTPPPDGAGLFEEKPATAAAAVELDPAAVSPPEVDESPPEEESWERSISASTSAEEEFQARCRSRRIIDTSFASQEFSSRHGKRTTTSLWDEFTAMDDREFRPYYYRARPPNSFPGFGLPYLIFHAKIYVFATRYLIPALAHLCLCKLHRDLVNLSFPDPDPDPDNQYAEQFVLTTTKARMVLDLLHYTYSKTTRLEPISPTAATQLRDNELRKLVVHYAACKIRDLAEYCPPVETIVGSPGYPEKPSARGLRALLDTTPELASDLIYRMI
ncbi:hypothetical protein ARAM_005204 [Aspergillus rambellii]|uniref:BTB domain-containing protein n=1 Tax=Aspergillus rambellii TaxID=308745 RepID=A0A0F8UAI8_9EURO|nr:hypothetical protein ARAM_005204 [Aspergillus rambellii]